MYETRRLRWRTAFSYVAMIVLVVAILVTFVARQSTAMVADAFDAQTRERVVQVLATGAIQEAWAQEPQTAETLLAGFATATGERITLLTPQGTPLADSHTLEATAETIRLPEVTQAVAEGEGWSTRFDEQLGSRVRYVAMPAPMGPDGETLILRWAFPTENLEQLERDLQRQVALAGALAALIISAFMVFQAERAAYTVRRLTHVAERISGGDLGARIISMSSGDIGQLARAFNRMAGKLENQIRKREREKDRLHTVLHVMTDGVMMVSKKGKVRLINAAAAEVLQTSEDHAVKRSFVQVVRDHRIAEVWSRCQESGKQESATLELDPNRFLRVVVTPYLKGADRGYLVILQDLTRMRRLQTIRQDFVSNVSHELRTPLASLRALVETLRFGAMEDPPAAERFLDRMETEVDSMTQMIQELLELSRIESGKVPLHLAPAPTEQVVAAPAERLRPQAERATVELVIESMETLPLLMVDAGRVQQVITNLVHNSIKFTPPGGRVAVSAHAPTNGRPMVTVCVTDNGVGIPADDLPRIFERFYKADRARAGGGTGLGLAIAKHIVQAHGGDIEVDSVQGQGSTFRFTLPMASEEQIAAADEIFAHVAVR